MSDDPTLTINPGYAVGQLLRALDTATTHDDPAARARAAQKADRWRAALRGMADGTTAVGGRTPVAGVPAWATLEVVTGGFATGALLAEGELRPHEVELLARVPRAPDVSARAALNAYHLSDPGLDALRAMLRSGRYRVAVPEEGALLAFVWLLDHGHAATAFELLDALSGFLSRLRFYPAPHAEPLASGPAVRLRTVAEVRASLAEMRGNPQVAAMNEALRVWNPLLDRAVALVLETARGEPPRLRVEGAELARRPSGLPIVDGGEVLQEFSAGWVERARAFVAEVDAARATYTLCKRVHRPTENFSRLVEGLREASRGDGAVSPKTRSAARWAVAGCVWRRGAPGSDALRRLREAQARWAATPSHAEYRRVLDARLAACPPDGGVTSMDPLTASLSEVEAAGVGVHAGASLPASLTAKAERCLEAPAEELVARGVIPSGDVLAVVLPQLTSQVRALGFDDPDLRRLYGAIDAAFARRRSLLLVNLQSQVKVSELPWVSSLDGARSRGDDATSSARAALLEVTSLALRSFPEAIVPNKLLQEVASLSKAAGLSPPLVDEIAADIFMGAFSATFLRAAQTAARSLRGTLYARYYDLPVDQVLALDDLTPRWGTKVSPGFYALCVARAGAAAKTGNQVARNGMVIEQSQVLTTHNLAALFEALDLRRALAPSLGDMALRCFASACRQLQVPARDRHARLVQVKSGAYAWRQMLFFASMLDDGGRASWLAACEARWGTLDESFRARFGPAWEGLRWVEAGGRFDGDGVGRDGAARRFLGWNTGKHWAI